MLSQQPCSVRFVEWPAEPMTKNDRTVAIVAICALIAGFLIYMGVDLYLKRGGILDCGDGPRTRIDMRNFTTEYWAYSLELQANVGKTEIKAKLQPVQLQALTEAARDAAEFRKYVVAGYNSCALTKAQYAEYEPRFRTLESMASEINQLLGKPGMSEREKDMLASLIRQYGGLVRDLSAK